jgi:type I restriction enzyme M protein
MDIPSDRKAFSKTKPIKSEHFECVREWWVNRENMQDEDGNYKAKRFTKEEIIAGSYNLDLCGYPHKVEEILEPMELILNYKEKRAELNAQIDAVLKEITAILENPEA